MSRDPVGEMWRRNADSFMREGLYEMYLALSGKKEAPDLERVFRQYSDVLSDAVVESVLRDLRRGVTSEPRTRMIANWLVTTLSMQDTAEDLQRVMQWQARALVDLPNGSVPYFAIDEAIRNAATTPEREVINDARAALVANELSPLVARKLARERDFAVKLGIAPSFLETWQALNGVDLVSLTMQCKEFLAATDHLWKAVRTKSSKRAQGEEVSHAVLQMTLRPREYDSQFAAVDLQATVKSLIQGMGIDPTAGGRIIVDAEDRPGKDSRASCVSVDVPNEVYLVINPKGGQLAWSHLLHEFGHALHYAYTEENLPLEFRRFGDTALTETFAYLFDHLLHEPQWVTRALPTMSRNAVQYTGALAAEELYLVRRYCGKLIYESELYADSNNWHRLPSRYARIMTDVTGYRHLEADAFIDVDSGLYVAHYIRARQAAAALADYLRMKFGPEWWSANASGKWLVEELFAAGYKWSVDEMATRVLGRKPSFQPLQTAIESRLVRAALV